MKLVKLLRYLDSEAVKMPSPVRTVRVWREGPGHQVVGYDIILDARVMLPAGDIASDQIDWFVNLDEITDFDGEEEPCELNTLAGPIITL